MKALSIRGDYAMDIFYGTKTVEYRSWSTHYRGDLLICNTAKKVPGSYPGHACCVVKLVNVTKYGNKDFGWQLAPFIAGGSYWIKPFPVKGQLGLFNVADSLICPAPVSGPTSPGAKKWFDQYIAPYIIH